jgi:hypothetical protein
VCLSLFLKLAVGREPHDTWRRQSRLVRGGSVQSRGARDNAGALPCREAGSRAIGHMAAPKPTSVKEAGSGAIRHVAVPKPTSTGRRGSEPRDAWQLVVAHSVVCLDFMPVHGGTRSTRYR